MSCPLSGTFLLPIGVRSAVGDADPSGDKGRRDRNGTGPGAAASQVPQPTRERSGSNPRTHRYSEDLNGRLLLLVAIDPMLADPWLGALERARVNGERPRAHPQFAWPGDRPGSKRIEGGT